MDSKSRPGPALSPMGEAGLLVSFENRIGPAVNARVQELRDAMVAARTAGLIDLVPAYASLLVTFDPDLTTHGDLAEAIFRVLSIARPGNPRKSSTSKTHIVPVQYGGEAGPDLNYVARSHDLTESELIRLHCARAYRAYFLGFLPGFAYLGSLAKVLRTPRLDTPRTRVAAGSVGIAEAQTAVYPFASPGGWRILGRTSLAIWNPFSGSPARIGPGDMVRFVQSESQPSAPPPSEELRQPARPLFEVLSASGLTTIQDLGRPGFAHLGLAQGGVFDPFAASRANALAGNNLSSAVLEMTWAGPTLRALGNATIALDGADLGCQVDGVSVPIRLSWFVRRGSMISFSGAKERLLGVRGYLAVSGGLDAPTLLGSRSTCLQAHFGGQHGRALRAGDVLEVVDPQADTELFAGTYWPRNVPDRETRQVELRFVAYHGRGEASGSARRDLVSRRFLLTDQADRMGYRFKSEDGEALPSRPANLLSFGVVRGAIQLPPDGNPVVLNVDHQTTGGYPLLGVVISADWPLLAQMQPGTITRFTEVTLEEANIARRRAKDDLAGGIRMVASRLLV